MIIFKFVLTFNGTLCDSVIIKQSNIIIFMEVSKCNG